MAQNWLLQSLIGLVFVTPAWLAIPFFKEQYGVQSSVFLVWYMVGCAIMVALYLAAISQNSGGSVAHTLVPSWKTVAYIMLVGLVCGGIANIAIFSAVVNAPNPGMAVAVMNGAAALTYLCSVFLARFLPELFSAPPFNWQVFMGIVLVGFGVALIALK